MNEFIDYNYEASEEALKKDFLGCVYAKALPTQFEDAMAYLVLLDNNDLSGDSGHRWCVMGDLMPAWGIAKTFDPIEGNKALFGHYIVQRDLVTVMGDSEKKFDGEVEFDPEGGTWFAYVPDAETGHRFIDWVADIINNTERTTA